MEILRYKATTLAVVGDGIFFLSLQIYESTSDTIYRNFKRFGRASISSEINGVNIMNLLRSNKQPHDEISKEDITSVMLPKCVRARPASLEVSII